MKKCKNCGRKNTDDSNFCENCGQQLTPENVVQLRSPKKNGGLAPLIVVGAVVIAGALVTMGVLLVRSQLPAVFQKMRPGGQAQEVSEESTESGDEQTLPEQPEGPGDEQTFPEQPEGPGDEQTLPEQPKEPGDEQTLPEQPEDGIQPADSTEIHRYRVIQEDMTWQEAYAESIRRGGYLARINSEEEFQTVIQVIEDAGLSKVHFFLSGRRTEDGSEYYWVDEKGVWMEPVLNPEGTSWAAGHWMENEPSFTSDGDVEMYLNLAYYQDHWVFNDVPNDITMYYPGRTGYIIEYED